MCSSWPVNSKAITETETVCVTAPQNDTAPVWVMMMITKNTVVFMEFLLIKWLRNVRVENKIQKTDQQLSRCREESVISDHYGIHWGNQVPLVHQ